MVHVTADGKTVLIQKIPTKHFQPCGDLQLLLFIYSLVVAALHEAHEGLLEIAEEGEGGIAGGDVEGALVLIGDEFRKVQHQIEQYDNQNDGVLLLHHPLDVVDMVVDDLTDKLPCLRMILPLTGTEHVVGLLIVIIGRASVADGITGIEIEDLQDVVVVFIITINLFEPGVVAGRLDEIAGQSEGIVFFRHALVL